MGDKSYISQNFMSALVTELKETQNFGLTQTETNNLLHL